MKNTPYSMHIKKLKTFTTKKAPQTCMQTKETPYSYTSIASIKAQMIFTTTTIKNLNPKRYSLQQQQQNLTPPKIVSYIQTRIPESYATISWVV